VQAGAPGRLKHFNQLLFEEASLVSTIDHARSDARFTQWMPLDSSVLLAARYTDADLLLQLAFRSGRVYQYRRVPPHIFTDLLSADSSGTYFNLNIRDHFPFSELPPPDSLRPLLAKI
jgi:hypothetical protein